MNYLPFREHALPKKTLWKRAGSRINGGDRDGI